jgi:hypothetical protein
MCTAPAVRGIPRGLGTLRLRGADKPGSVTISLRYFRPRQNIPGRVSAGKSDIY